MYQTGPDLFLFSFRSIINFTFWFDFFTLLYLGDYKTNWNSIFAGREFASTLVSHESCPTMKFSLEWIINVIIQSNRHWKKWGGISLDCVQIAVEFDWFLFWWPRIWESNQIFGPRFYDINNATNNTSSPITFDTNIHRVCGLYLEPNPRKISLFFVNEHKRQ